MFRDLGQAVERAYDVPALFLDRRAPRIAVLERADRGKQYLQPLSHIDVNFPDHPLEAWDVAHALIGGPGLQRGKRSGLLLGLRRDFGCQYAVHLLACPA